MTHFAPVTASAGGTLIGLAAALLVPARLLVSFGTKLRNGCTSGHGVRGALLFNLLEPHLPIRPRQAR